MAKKSRKESKTKSIKRKLPALILRCGLCQCRFFNNDLSLKIAKTHYRLCRGIMSKEPKDFNRIVISEKSAYKKNVPCAVSGLRA